MQTLTERTARRSNKQMPSFRQLAAATEIMARVNGEKTVRSATEESLAPYVRDGQVTLHERLDAARLTEERLLRTIANGLDAKRKDTADHDIRLKSSKLALELRGLLQRGNRASVNVGIGGNANVAVAVPWSPGPDGNDNSTIDSNSSITTQRSIATGTVRSTIEGTGSGRGAPTHSRRVQKSVPVEHMSLLQLKNVPADVRANELERRIKLRDKKNKRRKVHVGPNHISRTHVGRKGGGACKSGRCGRCNECRRRAKLRLPDAK